MHYVSFVLFTSSSTSSDHIRVYIYIYIYIYIYSTSALHFSYTMVVPTLLNYIIRLSTIPCISSEIQRDSISATSRYRLPKRAKDLP
jgi:hypothetical protein